MNLYCYESSIALSYLGQHRDSATGLGPLLKDFSTSNYLSFASSLVRAVVLGVALVESGGELIDVAETSV